MHASSGRAGLPAPLVVAAELLVVAAALLVEVATSKDVVATVSGVLEAVLVVVVAFCAVEPDVEEHPAEHRTSAAVITWCALSLLFMTGSPPPRTRAYHGGTTDIGTDLGGLRGLSLFSCRWPGDR